MKLIIFSIVKKVYYVKRQDFYQNIFEKLAFSGNGAGTGTVCCHKSELAGTINFQKSEPEP
jgi:hypothetical protein